MDNDVALDEQGNYRMRGAEAMLAGTLVLMSSYAQCTCPKAISNKDLMMKKIVTNLQQLQQQPDLTLQFRMVLSNLYEMWSKHAFAEQVPTSVADNKDRQEMWHATPTVLQ